MLAKLREQEPVGYLHPEKDKAISISDLNDQQLWTQAMWKIGKPLYLHPAPIPEDMVLVPKIATEAMKDAVWKVVEEHEIQNIDYADIHVMYCEILAAARSGE